MFQLWRQATQTRPLAGLELTDHSAARFVRIGSATPAKTVLSLGPCISGLLETASAWRQASRVALLQQQGDALVLERLRTQHSHSLGGRRMMCNRNLAGRIGGGQTHSYSWRFHDAVEPAFARFRYSKIGRASCRERV